MVKRFVNGEEAELSSDGVEVLRLADRLIVRKDGLARSSVAVRSGDAILVSYNGRQYRVEKKPPRSAVTGGAGSGELRAPMPGAIVDVLVAAGDSVRKGDKILVLEAMKTQQPFVAPFDGILKRLEVAKGDQVGDGQLLALVVAAGESP